MRMTDQTGTAPVRAGSFHYGQTGLAPTSLSGMSGRAAFLLSAAAMLLLPAILNRPIRVGVQRSEIEDGRHSTDEAPSLYRVSYGGKNLGSELSSAPRDRGSTKKKWVGTLSDDLTGAVESSLGEVPEGWIQAYGPASIVEILHNGIPTEVELIEPLLLDPFGSATFQLYYK